MKKYYTESRRRGMSYVQYKEGRLTGLVTDCVENRRIKHVIEGKIEGRTEMTRKRGRRCKQLLDGLTETRENCKLKEETLDRTV
jgi:hypothetical protein